MHPQVELILGAQAGSNRLRALETCHRELERMLANEQSQLQAEVEGQLTILQAGSDAAEIYKQDMQDSWDNLWEVYPLTIRYALFARCVSEFEIILVTLAKKYQAAAKLALPVTELKGDGIQRCRVYFEKVALLKFPSDIQEWHDAISLNRMRNIVVHNDARISIKDATDMRPFLVRWEGEILINERSQIILSPTLLKKAVNCYRVLLQLLARLNGNIGRVEEKTSSL